MRTKIHIMLRGMDLEIVSRGDWGAKPPVKPLASRRSFVNGWFVHWHGSDYDREKMTDEQIMQSIQRFHQIDKGWGRIGYSFAVGRDGRVFEGVGWGHVGAHTAGYNSTALGVCFLVGPNDPPVTDRMWEAFLALRSFGVSKGVPMFPVSAHKAVGATECPGAGLAMLVQGLRGSAEVDPVRNAQHKLNTLGGNHSGLLSFEVLKVDGNFGTKTFNALSEVLDVFTDLVGDGETTGQVPPSADWRTVSPEIRLLAAAWVAADGGGQGRWDAALLLAGFQP